MRILQIAPAYYPAVFWGGPVVSVGLLCKELKKLGEDVGVYTTAIGLEKNQYAENFVDDVKVSYFKYFKFGKWAIPIGFIKKFKKTAENFDIIHLHQIWDPIIWLTGLICIKKRKKIIISPRGSIDPVLIRKKSYFIKKILYWLFIKRIFKNASGFHFTSEYEKKQFSKFTKNQFVHKPSEIIFNPLDISEFQKDVNKNILDKWGLKDKQYFLYLGRINWKKGIDILIRGYARIKTQINTDDYCLVIAGPDENNYKSKLEKLIKEQGISDRVIFTGLVKGDDKLVLLKNAIAFVLPSLGENFGIAVAEAMACGTPVIISKFVGIANIVEKYNGGLICELDENDLAEKMKKIVNLDLRNKLIQNGKKLVENEFNAKKITEQMMGFYVNV